MSHIARFICEVSIESNFPPRIFACAMKYFFAFQEFTGKEYDSSDIIMGITCLLVSVKANESLLNSSINNISSSGRTSLLIENSVRSILSYANKELMPTAELFCGTSKKVKESVARSELTLLRIIGNSFDPLVACPSEWTQENTGGILAQFSTPACLV